MSNPPAYQYYPDDMANDPIVQLWDMEQMGCYHQMIDYLWISGGSCLENIDILRRIFRVFHQRRARKLWASIRVKFQIENGIITQKRVTKEMQRQAAYRLKKSKAGKKGAEKKWKNNGSARNLPMAKDSSPTPSPTPSPNYTHTQSNFTLDDVIDTGKMMGLPPDKAEEFYHHFNAQGWKRGNGQRITNLRSAMVYWRNHQSEFKKGIPNANTSKTPVSIYEDDTATSAKRL